MLTGKKIAVIGGDDRYLHVISYLSKKGATIYAVGFQEIKFEQNHVQQVDLQHIDFRTLDGIVLPIGGTNRFGAISTYYGGKEAILTKEIVVQTKPTCVIYTGTASDYLRNLAAECERKLVVLFERDDVAIANSIPTAEAALQLAMENTKYTIHGANVLVVGYGRIGVTIARLFQNVGANVSVAARKDADFARIREMRMSAIRMERLSDAMENTDICINTVPKLVLTEEVLGCMNREGLIIDLASKPGGTDFEATEKLGIQALHALGLPGKVAPKTAGLILGETIAELVVRSAK